MRFEILARDAGARKVYMASAAPPVLVSRQGRAMQLATEAVADGFGAPPVLISVGVGCC